MRFTVREIASWMGIVNFLLQRLAKVPCYVNDSFNSELDLYCKHPPITLYLECLAVLIIHLVIVWIQGAFIQVFQPVFDFARPFVTL